MVQREYPPQTSYVLVLSKGTSRGDTHVFTAHSIGGVERGWFTLEMPTSDGKSGFTSWARCRLWLGPGGPVVNGR